MMEVDVIVKTFDHFQIQVPYTFTTLNNNFFVSMSIVKVACSKSDNVRLVNKNHHFIALIIIFYYESNVDKSDYSMPIHILQNEP